MEMCGKEVGGLKMDLNADRVEVVVVLIRGDIGQLCIGNWISLVLQNTEEFLNAAMSVSF